MAWHFLAILAPNFYRLSLRDKKALATERGVIS